MQDSSTQPTAGADDAETVRLGAESLEMAIRFAQHAHVPPKEEVSEWRQAMYRLRDLCGKPAAFAGEWLQTALTLLDSYRMEVLKGIDSRPARAAIEAHLRQRPIGSGTQAPPAQAPATWDLSDVAPHRLAEALSDMSDYTRATTQNERAQQLSELIDRYWDIAFAEGQEGRQHDTAAGDAQSVRSQMDRLIQQLATAGQDQ